MLHFFRFWPLKCIFGQFTVIFCPLIILPVKWPKMHFNGQNWKKWRKRTPLIFWFYINICPPTFSWGPLGWENDIFSKNRTCLIWRHIFPESLMPPGQFAILVTSGHLFKTVLHFWTHVPWSRCWLNKYTTFNILRALVNSPWTFLWKFLTTFW